MKTKFKRLLLIGLSSLSLSSVNAFAGGWEHDASLDSLLGRHFIDIADDVVNNTSPNIINTVVNIGEVDASLTIKGERVSYEADYAKSRTYDAGTGPLGNSLGENVSWGNSIDTMANGAYASVLVVGLDSSGRHGDNDFFSTGTILNTAFNTADINSSVYIKGYEKVDISNLHISTQAIGAYGSVTLTNGYQSSERH
jgi:hypothetical protein